VSKELINLADLNERPASLLDARVLLAACDGNGVILTKIVETLRAHLPPELLRAEACLQRQDAEALREAAHRLAGMVSAVSTAAASVASKLEDQAALGDLTEAPELIQQLDEMIRDVLVEVEHTTIEHLQRLVVPPNISTQGRAHE
jgi:HPt (histidine-containing phosphotransfer) domain-containing protein